MSLGLLLPEKTLSAVTLMPNHQLLPLLDILLLLHVDILTINTRSLVPFDKVNDSFESLSSGSKLCSCLPLPYGRHLHHHHYYQTHI